MILWSSNELIDDDLIKSMVLELKSHPLCYEEKANYYSSYYTPPNERPEKKLKKFIVFQEMLELKILQKI